MKPVRYLLPIIAVAAGLASASAFAQEARNPVAGQDSDFERRQDETDRMTTREFIQSKENIDVRQKATNIELSGDVRFEWRHMNETGKRFFAFEEEEVIVPLSGSGSSSGSSFSEEVLPVESSIPSYSSSSDMPISQRYTLLRGDHAVDNRLLPLSRNDWDVEFNLKIKYTYGRAWAAAHLQFDNSAGIRGFNDCFSEITALGVERSSGSFSYPYFDVFDSPYYPYSSSDYNVSPTSRLGSSESGDFIGVALVRDTRFTCKGSGESGAINLKRAYMGYNIYADGVHRLDVEIGRRKLNDLFDSEIQFGARFDGVVFKYASAIDKFSDWYANIATFVIDERVNHIGYAFEVGLLDIFDTGLDLKYSFIDWTKRGKNRCFVRHPIGTEFRNSQFTFAYHMLPEIYCKKIPTELYGGFVINHAARPNVLTHYKKKNLGFYLGMIFGEVDKEGDWSFDITYEYVEPQMASGCDVDGIGRGNILNENFTDIVIAEREVIRRGLPVIEEIFVYPRRGNGNFQGFSFEFFYAITDNLSLNTIYEFTNPTDSSIGGKHFYSNAEIEFIYAF